MPEFVKRRDGEPPSRAAVDVEQPASGARQSLLGALKGLGFDKGSALLSPKGGETTPEAGKGGLMQGLLGKLQGLVVSPPTKEQRAAMEYARSMLEPNKLGGADRTFNDADLSAVVGALMRDTCGLSQEVQKQLRSEGKGGQANLARRGLAGGRGPLAAMARNKVYQDAPCQIRGELASSLRKEGIDPKTGKDPDCVPRDITFEELRQFEACSVILKQMQAEAEQRLNMHIGFPGGLSAASMDHQLEGKFGIPPGAQLRPFEEKKLKR